MSDDSISRQAAIDVADKFSDADGCNGSDVAMDIISGLISLPSVQPERWIPVSERLPKDVELGEEYPMVIFCDSRGTVYVGFCEYSIYGIKWWNTTDWEDVVDNVIAWMPLPSPYKGERNETDLR